MLLKMALFRSFQWLNTTPLYTGTTSSLPAPLPMDIQVASMNTAAMNTGVRVSFHFMFYSRDMPKSGNAGPYDSSVFRFLRKLHTVLYRRVPLYIPTSSTGVFPSPISSLACTVWGLFEDGHSDHCDLRPHYTFDFHFSNN